MEGRTAIVSGIGPGMGLPTRHLLEPLPSACDDLHEGRIDTGIDFPGTSTPENESCLNPATPNACR
ncbi:hypothetical protein N8077_06065 [Myxococcota bacterium]|nr:hypothetical protein [Myxococcota bacterium]